MLRWVCSLFLVLPLLGYAQVPREALSFQRDVIRESRMIWGLDAPIAAFASQIHQESGWNPRARSAYASGLTQFTPDTAAWISTRFKELAVSDPLNPQWAIRAMVRYNRYLHERVAGESACDRMAFTLSAYNGGLGWVQRDKKLAQAKGSNPNRWFGHVELHNGGRSPSAFKENRGYPHRILKVIQPRYLSWGPGISCN